MTLVRVAAVVLLSLFPLASYADESAYDRAVDAYRAEKYDEAFRLWSEAASHGSVDALSNLGFLLSHGLGVTEDRGEAIDLWRTAAYAGHSEAKWHLEKASELGKRPWGFALHGEPFERLLVAIGVAAGPHTCGRAGAAWQRTALRLRAYAGGPS